MKQFYLTLSATLLLLAMAMPVAAEDITFADPNVKAICVENWDTDGDGELSMEEAATVEDLGEVFRGNEMITSFDELQYFTGLPFIGDYAFNDCGNLTSVTIPSVVTYIGRNAFAGCKLLASIIIPDDVTEIDYDAFMSCQSLTSVVIPYGVTILNQTFPACFNLSSVVIPNSVTTITNHSFYYCALTSVTIPNSVTSIGGNAFGYCNNLTTVKVENATPVGIAESVFTNRTNATLFVPVGSKEAYANASYWREFKNIIEDKNIDFEDDAVKALCVANWDKNGDGEISVSEAMAVENLGGVFAGNTTITSFEELNYFTGLSAIGTMTNMSLRDVPFWAHTNGWGLDAPKNTQVSPAWVIGASSGLPYGDVSVRAFADLSDYDKLTISFSEGMPRILLNRDVDEGQWDEDESQSHLIDNTKGGWSAKYFTTNDNTITVDLKQLVEDKGFAHLHAIKGANGENVIVESLKVVGKSNTTSGFYGCTALESVSIPVNVKSLGDNAFGGCNSLKSMTIPANVKSLGDNVFDGCNSLTSVTVRWTNPVAITEQCFTNRANATLNVPAGCVTAYAEADYWKEFGNIEEDNNILFVDDKVRELCVAAWDTDGDGGLSMEEAAAVTDFGTVFKNSKITSFNELQYFTGLTALDWNTFYNCTNLTSVIIPKNVASISENAFIGCNSLAYLMVESSNASYDSRENCNAIIRTADNVLITGCMTTIVPNGVTEIGYDAFYLCSGLYSITIPSSVTSIGVDAFYGCSGLTTVIVENPTPVTIGSYTFSNRKNATLIVPKGCIGAYANADYWKEFKGIVEAGEVVITELVTNGNLEGSDVSCFFSKERNGDKEPATIVDGAGVNNSRSIVITSTAGGTDAWDTQFYIRLKKSLPAGTEFAISFDYKASADVSINSQSHNEPLQYIQWGVIGSPSCTTEWKHFNKTVTVPAECDGSGNDSGFKNDFHTIALDLATDNTQDITFYFDNISVKVKEEIILGDVDGDGEITAQDASLVLQLVAGKITTETEGVVYGAADVDGDDEVTAQDASLILQHVAGKITIGN